jgi:hypothetical protein
MKKGLLLLMVILGLGMQLHALRDSDHEDGSRIKALKDRLFGTSLSAGAAAVKPVVPEKPVRLRMKPVIAKKPAHLKPKPAHLKPKPVHLRVRPKIAAKPSAHVVAQAVAAHEKERVAQNDASHKLIMVLDTNQPSQIIKPNLHENIVFNILENKNAPVLVSWQTLNSVLQRMQNRFPVNRRFKNTSFSADQWKVYHHPDNGLFLLVPNSMEHMTDTTWHHLADGTEVAVAPFATADAKQINVEPCENNILHIGLDQNELLTQTVSNMDYLSTSDAVEFDHLADYFFNVDDFNEQLDDSEDKSVGQVVDDYRSVTRPWDIFVTGHRTHPESHQNLMELFRGLNVSNAVLANDRGKVGR